MVVVHVETIKYFVYQVMVERLANYNIMLAPAMFQKKTNSKMIFFYRTLMNIVKKEKKTKY